jgi:hypothetical protein
MRVIPTAEQFLTAPELAQAKKDVPVPELGAGMVIPVWGMTPRERSAWEDKQTQLSESKRAKHKLQVRERILVECCRNDDGVQLFTADQIEQLGKRRGDVIERLVNVALDLSGFSEQDIEKIAKNSDAALED